MAATAAAGEAPEIEVERTTVTDPPFRVVEEFVRFTGGAQSAGDDSEKTIIPAYGAKITVLRTADVWLPDCSEVITAGDKLTKNRLLPHDEQARHHPRARNRTPVRCDHPPPGRPPALRSREPWPEREHTQSTPPASDGGSGHPGNYPSLCPYLAGPRTTQPGADRVACQVTGHRHPQITKWAGRYPRLAPATEYRGLCRESLTASVLSSAGQPVRLGTGPGV